MQKNISTLNPSSLETNGKRTDRFKSNCGHLHLSELLDEVFTLKFIGSDRKQCSVSGVSEINL